MRTSLLLLLLTSWVALSCKKHKDPPPKAVLPTLTALESYKVNTDNNIKPVWYALGVKDEHLSMKEIVADNALEAKVLFGRYQDGGGDGLYAPSAYPVLYGQQVWTVKNKTIFRKPAFTKEEFQKVIDNEHEEVTDSYIEQAFKNATIIGDKVTKIGKGDVFVFETQDGKTRGIILVVGYFAQVHTLQVWIK